MQQRSHITSEHSADWPESNLKMHLGGRAVSKNDNLDLCQYCHFDDPLRAFLAVTCRLIGAEGVQRAEKKNVTKAGPLQDAVSAAMKRIAVPCVIPLKLCPANSARVALQSGLWLAGG